MKKLLISSSVLLLVANLQGCRPVSSGQNPQSNAQLEGTAQQKSQKIAEDTSNSDHHLIAVWAKPYKMAITNPKICQPASLEDHAGCTIYDIQSIKTNVKWINHYYDESLKKQYKDAFGINKNVEIPPSADNYEYYVGAMINFKNQRYNLVTFSQLDNSYTGGAHNHYSVNYDVFDLNLQKKLALNDILQPNVKDKVLALLKKYNVSELKKYGTDLTDLHLSENFYLTESGLMLVYSPYEIAPWVFGTPELYIPYEELKGLLKTAYIPAQPDTTLIREFS